MFYNSCAKCGTEFETKNPKRVICPDCLYPEKPAGDNAPAAPQSGYRAPSPGAGGRPNYARPQGGPGGPGGYNQGPGPGGRPNYARPQGGPGSYGGGRPGGYGGGRPPQGGRFSNFGGPRRSGPPGRPPMGGGPRKKLVSPEEVAKIEAMYQAALPLPNPDLHEVIGEQLDMKPSKVFFAINLIRLKMKLPKLEFPKRKLAVSEDQLTAVESLYQNFLPLPPIGIHKIIAKQLKMDEWRVHVAIKLIRKNHNLPRWNEERQDLPEAMKKSLAEKAEREAAEAKEAEKTASTDDAETTEKEAPKPKKAAAKKAEPKTDDKTEESEQPDEAVTEEDTAKEPAEEKPKKKAAAKKTVKKAPAKKTAAKKTDAEEAESTTEPAEPEAK